VVIPRLLSRSGGSAQRGQTPHWSCPRRSSSAPGLCSPACIVAPLPRVRILEPL